jgi:hypothetical protein
MELIIFEKADQRGGWEKIRGGNGSRRRAKEINPRSRGRAFNTGILGINIHRVCSFTPCNRKPLNQNFN